MAQPHGLHIRGFIKIGVDSELVHELACGHRRVANEVTSEGATIMDRSEINRALAKAIAYKACGKQEAAEEWAKILIRQLECEGILKDSRPMQLMGSN